VSVIKNTQTNKQKSLLQVSRKKWPRFHNTFILYVSSCSFAEGEHYLLSPLAISPSQFTPEHSKWLVLIPLL